VQQDGEQIRTDIADENDSPPAKAGKRVWLYVGLGAALLAVVFAILFVAVRRRGAGPVATVADQEQQKYDAGQQENDRQKTARLRDDTFLVRKEDDYQAQLNSLLKDLNIDSGRGMDLPMPVAEQKARAEEEAIEHVLRNPAPNSLPSTRSYQLRPNTPQALSAPADANVRPMFVYSRTFGGAKYVDLPPKPEAQISSTPSSEASPPRATNAPSMTPAQGGPHSADDKTRLIYSDYPPTTIHEGEMLEAVLVNRIIADTEPSPVVCSITKDVFDRSARYVIFPANSRIVGLSQVVSYKGAHRLFINFQRIILPNGASLDLPPSRKALKALDETGALGVVSKVERHWFLQFGTALLFGALDGLAGAAQRNRDVFSTRAVVIGRTSENFERILENIMTQYSTIVPTIRVDQGKRMRIYLADDVLISPYARVSDRSYYERP
jgi:type IV secretory pathway VirB10-like protein